MVWQVGDYRGYSLRRRADIHQLHPRNTTAVTASDASHDHADFPAAIRAEVAEFHIAAPVTSAVGIGIVTLDECAGVSKLVSLANVIGRQVVPIRFVRGHTIRVNTVVNVNVILAFRDVGKGDGLREAWIPVGFDDAIHHPSVP